MLDTILLFVGTSFGVIGAGFSSMAMQDGPHKLAFQIVGMIMSALATGAMAFAPKVQAPIKAMLGMDK